MERARTVAGHAFIKFELSVPIMIQMNRCDDKKEKEVDPMACPACSAENREGAKFCSECGQNLKGPDEGIRARKFLGAYEVAAYDHPVANDLPASAAEEIFDRDAPRVLRKSTGSPLRRGITHTILLAMMLFIGALSYFGIQAVADRRIDETAVLARQADLQKEAQAKAERDAYIRRYREFLILAQAQSGSFQANLEELQSVEGKRWLTHFFLGGLFDRMVVSFQDSEEVRAMAKRNQSMTDLSEGLSEPPKGLGTLEEKALRLKDLSGQISAAFSGEITEDTLSRIRGLLSDYDSALPRAQEALQGIS